MKVCKNHKKRDCSTCQTGAYATSATSPTMNPWLYMDVSPSFDYSDSSGSSSSSSSCDSGGSGGYSD